MKTLTVMLFLGILGSIALGVSLEALYIDDRVVVEYACVKQGSFSNKEKIPVLGFAHTRDICPAGTEMIRLK